MNLFIVEDLLKYFPCLLKLSEEQLIYFKMCYFWWMAFGKVVQEKKLHTFFNCFFPSLILSLRKHL